VQATVRRYHHVKRPFCHFLGRPPGFLTDSTSFRLDAIKESAEFSGLRPKIGVQFYKNEFLGMFLNFVLDSLTVLANMVRIVAVLGVCSG
jgi:hypothetical protein